MDWFWHKGLFSSQPQIEEKKKLTNEKEIKKTGVVNFEFIAYTSQINQLLFRELVDLTTSFLILTFLFLFWLGYKCL